MRIAPTVTLDAQQHERLQKLAHSRLSSVRLPQRAQIVLLAARGMSNKDIAAQLGIGRVQAGRWRQRYVDEGLQGIARERPGRGRPVALDVDKLAALTTQSAPQAATHWSTRRMVAELGVAPSTVMRHWHKLGLKPHLERSFKVSRDPKFFEKLQDIVGLYMAPPEHALVLCLDEKSRIQALDRTQPGLPLKKGRGRHHDARLQAPRHHDAVCCAEHPRWSGHRSVPAAPHTR